ncbi:MAG: response regulator [Candidatus Omnitrophica bacterium]|nr:response regulator [Candidatus Omnitrophota bacterium]
MFIGVGAGYFFNYRLFLNTIGNDYSKMAENLAFNVSGLLEKAIENVTTHAANPIYAEAVLEGETRYKDKDGDYIKEYFSEMDKNWAEAKPDSDLIAQCLQNRSAQRLRQYTSNDKSIAEIFTTDKWGGLVAASGKTSDFYQADEGWWQEAYNCGKGAVYIDNVEYDESSGIMSLPVAVPIRDKKGEVIGVCKAVLRVEVLFAPMMDFDLGRTGHAVLVDNKGLIVFHAGIKPLSERLCGEKEYERLVADPKKWGILKKPHGHKKNMFVSFAVVNNSFLLNEGIVWRVFIDEDVDDVFLPLNKLFSKLLLSSGIAIAILFPVAFIFGGIFVKPIKKLHEATEHIGKGELDYSAEIKTGDELEGLADAFNKMTENLRSSTTSIDRLNEEIAQRKGLEQALIQSEEKYKTLYTSSRDAIMTLEPPDWRFTAGNPATIELFGAKDEKEFTSMGPWQLSPEHQPDGMLSSAKAKRMIETAMEKGFNFFEWTHKRLNGEDFFATVLLTRMELEGKQILQATVRDITEHKRMEAKLKEAMEVKGHFVSMVSHELRTPMTAIKEGIGIVLDGSAGGINDDQRDFLDLAKRNVDRLSRLINDVLDYQRLEAGRTTFRMQETDVNALIDEVVKIMLPIAKNKNLSLEARLAPGLPKMICDKDKITQVLINMINNAVKFTDKGGVVVTTARDGDSIQVSVRDTGMGIKKEDIPKLFQGFSQLETAHVERKGSSGLGLAISKKIIQEHGGEIWVESEYGKGSDFKFRLPVRTRYKVLLVDDERDILDIYKGSLEGEGYEVACSESGLNAMDMIRKDKPDILVLDMRLKDINGYEIIGRLRTNKETATIPILAMSGYAEELGKLEDKREDSALSSISKPFQLKDLLSKMRLLLKQEVQGA